MRTLLTLAAVVSLAASLAACKNNPADPPSNDNSGRPKTGSSFEFDLYDYGSTSPDRTFKFVAGPSGVNYNGRSNVVVFDLIPDAFIIDSLAFAYATNGDFETPFFQGYGFNSVDFYVSGWTAMGTTNTGKNRALVTYDTSAVVDGVPTTFSFRRVGSYVGTESFQVGGKALIVHKSVYAQSTTVRGATTYDEAQVDTVWYAPSIGMIARWASMEESEDTSGSDASGQSWMLKSYSLK
jgi:hypothetical protein